MPPSKEALGIIDWMTRTGIPFVVTSKFPATPGVHAPRSYHYQKGTEGDSLAVDLWGPNLEAIHNAYKPIRLVLAELLGPGDPGHDDHVHVAVRLGTILTNGGPITMPDDPNLPNLYAPLLGFYPIFDSTGKCTGYYMVSEKGEVHSFGPGAIYYGRSEIVQ